MYIFTVGVLMDDVVTRAFYASVGTSHGPVSVTSRSSIKTAERIKLGFGVEAPFHCVLRKCRCLQK